MWKTSFTTKGMRKKKKVKNRVGFHKNGIRKKGENNSKGGNE